MRSYPLTLLISFFLGYIDNKKERKTSIEIMPSVWILLKSEVEKKSFAPNIKKHSVISNEIGISPPSGWDCIVNLG